MPLETLVHVERPSSAWITFSYVSFAASIVIVIGGVAALPFDWWVRGYFAASIALVVQSTFTLSKSLRDVHESSRMINRIEEARTERLLRTEQ